MKILYQIIIIISLISLGCENDSKLVYKTGKTIIQKDLYKNKLEGFWLGQCIGNWTGLITEMDKIGIAHEGKGKGFYTRKNWGGKDEPNIWDSNKYSETITFFFADEDSIWGADDDTDIEYMYQEIILKDNTPKLSGKQIQKGWLNHIYKKEENFLWVSNQRAFDLMQKGILPPETSNPKNNIHYEMIDAQLTTEIFGFFAPTRPDIALEISHLPILTTARKNAKWIAEFNVIMYSLASIETTHNSLKDKIHWMANQARKHLPNDSYSAKMYDFVKASYLEGKKWEETRDELNLKYQIRQEDDYLWATKDKSCNGCFAAGINFGASIISLLYGEGDIKETIKIGTLAGWDSDNPTATWAGLLGFMLGKDGIEKVFNRKFSEKFNIHRTRKGFDNDGIDTFENMAEKGLKIVDLIVSNQMNGSVYQDKWIFDSNKIIIP